MSLTTLQWLLLVASSLALFAVAPLARTAGEFFGGRRADRAPGVVALTSSLVISWLFAKSLTNAANLGLAFGLVGGVAYATYYLSFAVAGDVIYRMRTEGGFGSLHEFLLTRFGRGALVVFSLLIGLRLFNEVWSNTLVIGSYFGGVGEPGYYAAIIVFTLLTLAYSLKGGMSSSILTDIIQMGLFRVLLIVLLGVIFPETEGGVGAMATSGEWGWATGGNLILVAILQSFSYPFHDPVLTDRGFLSDPTTTRRAFFWAVPVGFVCIVLFSLVGVFAAARGLDGQAAVAVAKYFGGPVLLVVNLIMITSAASTLDSTFTSFAKLGVVDLGTLFKGAGSRVQGESKPPDPQRGRSKGLAPSVRTGRWAMVLITVLGTIPVFLSPEILSATTVSGAMVMGLAPVFAYWKLPASPLSFYLSVGFGVVCGVAYAAGLFPAAWNLTEGKYATLLTVTLIEFVGCILLFAVGVNWKAVKNVPAGNASTPNQHPNLLDHE